MLGRGPRLNEIGVGGKELGQRPRVGEDDQVPDRPQLGRCSLPLPRAKLAKKPRRVSGEPERVQRRKHHRSRAEPAPPEGETFAPDR